MGKKKKKKKKKKKEEFEGVFVSFILIFAHNFTMLLLRCLFFLWYR